MEIAVSVEITKMEDGIYSVWISHNESSGCEYHCVSLDGVGECVKTYIRDLQEEFDEDPFFIT